MLVPINYRDVMPNMYMVTDNAEFFQVTEAGLVDITHTIKRQTSGYWHISLKNVHGYRKAYPIYRIVLASFTPGGDKPHLVVDHVDANKDHNYLSNLEYVTSDENLRRSAKLRGIEYRQILTVDQVERICELIVEGNNARQIMRILGMEPTSTNDTLLDHIIHRQTWKRISKKYKWDVDDVRLKKYTKEDLRVIANLVVNSGLTPKEITERFPKYEYKQLHQTIKKMRQGVLYKKFLDEAGSTTISNEVLRDSDGFIRLVPTELGAKQLRKIRADEGHKQS